MKYKNKTTTKKKLKFVKDKSQNTDSLFLINNEYKIPISNCSNGL